MKIAIAAKENHLKSEVDRHFGRTDWFCIYDSEKDNYAFVENIVRYEKDRAGCDAAEMLIRNGINMAVAGRFGSKVSEFFRQHQVQMVVVQKETNIKNVINIIKGTANQRVLRKKDQNI
ncbi:MAG: NifB/NifX family molybdenum-iron cluster-binding protein [Sphingobacteriales bacterium]|jgi:predicted Fe-Mo cluster-binding NifX family protein|nr:NifB/NifX family molybdenum-iron cluster-binding protein [Sphingobacteriales bacterium]